MRTLASALVVFVAVSSPVYAEEPGPLTVKQLADDCQILSDVMEGEADQKYPNDNVGDVAARTMQAGICVGYIQGFLGGVSYGSYGQPKRSICVPAGVSTPQLARMIVKMVKGAPEIEHQPALTVAVAVGLLFPCPANGA